MSVNTVKHIGENKMKRCGVFVIVVFVLVRLTCDFSSTTEMYSEKNDIRRHKRYLLFRDGTCLLAKYLIKWLKMWFIPGFG